MKDIKKLAIFVITLLSPYTYSQEGFNKIKCERITKKHSLVVKDGRADVIDRKRLSENGWLFNGKLVLGGILQKDKETGELLDVYECIEKDHLFFCRDDDHEFTYYKPFFKVKFPDNISKSYLKTSRIQGDFSDEIPLQDVLLSLPDKLSKLSKVLNPEHEDLSRYSMQVYINYTDHQLVFEDFYRRGFRIRNIESWCILDKPYKELPFFEEKMNYYKKKKK